MTLTCDKLTGNESAQRASAAKIRTLIRKECGPVTWERDVWEDTTEAENFEPSGFQGFISPEEVDSPCSAENVIYPTP